MSLVVKFTIWHGFAASLVVHSALALPFLMHRLESPPQDPSPLVIELQGVVANVQTEQKTIQDMKGAAQQKDIPEATPAIPPAEENPKDIEQKTDQSAEERPSEAEPLTQTAPLTPGAANAAGAEVKQAAQIIADRDADADRVREYVKTLHKKVYANFDSKEGRKTGLWGDATVSFTIVTGGQIRAETLKIVASSGRPKLDENVLAAVRASTPFESPPREMTLTIVVGFGRKD